MIIDVVIPGISGFELCKKIRNNNIHPDNNADLA